MKKHKEIDFSLYIEAIKLMLESIEINTVVRIAHLTVITVVNDNIEKLLTREMERLNDFT